MSKAASAQYRNTCPVCKAGFKMPCRTLKTGRVTDTHMARVQAQFNREPRIMPTPTPDPPISYMSRYFPVQRERVTESALDSLASLGYSRSKSIAILTN